MTDEATPEKIAHDILFLYGCEEWSKHLIPSDGERRLEELIARALRERERLALERAARLVVDEEGWEPVIVTDKSEGRYRDELDLDATVTRIAAAIRGLIQEGDR